MTICSNGEIGMGVNFGLEDNTRSFKRKFRWLFKIPGISASDEGIAHALPHRRGARPSLSFKEVECQHLSETIYFPIKPEWKELNLVLYDIGCKSNPVYQWVSQLYNPSGVGPRVWNPPVSGTKTTSFKKNATLDLLDGCGNTIERWQFDNCYPKQADWGDLDMDSSDVLTVDVTIRYDRAWLVF